MKEIIFTQILLRFVVLYSVLCPIRIMGQEELPPIELGSLNRSTLKLCFENIRVLSLESFQIVDLEDDGTDELILIQNDLMSQINQNYIILESIERNRTKFMKTFKGSLWTSSSKMLYDLDDDGIKEFFVSELRSDTAFIHILNSEGEVLFSIIGETKPESIIDEWDSSVFPEAFSDIDGDGKIDIIYSIRTGYAYQPRGIYAVNVRTNETLWQHRGGFWPKNCLMVDVNGDGEREIIISTDSPNNGEDAFGKDYLINGTDDRHVYLTVLDSLGNLKSRLIIGEEYARTKIYARDLNADEIPEILVQFSSHRDPREESFIAIWDVDNNRLGPKKLLSKYPSENFAFLDANRDGKDDLLIGWEDGTVEIRDEKLDIIRTRHFPGFIIKVLLIVDHNSDGEEEIIVTGQYKGQLTSIVLDHLLRLLAYDNGLEITGIVNTGYGKEKWMLASRLLEDQHSYLVRLKGQVRLPPLASWQWILFGMLMGGIPVAALFGALYYRRTKKCKENTMRTVLASDRIPSLVLDPGGRLLIINGSMEKLLGQKKETAIGLTYERFFLQSGWKPVIDIIRTFYEESRTETYEELTVSLEESQLDIVLYIHSLWLPLIKHHWTIVKIQDVTEMSEVKRTVAWATMAQRLAHEVKTPLSTVMLSAQRLQTETRSDKVDAKVFDKYIERILRQVRRLQMLTDAFLKFTRIEKPQFESVDFNQFIRQWINKNQFRFGPDIDIETLYAGNLPKISVDTQQIRIILQNIVDNGLKAMDGKGTLTITTRLVQSLHTNQLDRRNDAIQLEIADTGKGISKEDLKELFKPFFSKSAGGTGLGLVLVKKIVEDHQGKIQIESESEVGTRVIISLPVRRNRINSSKQK